jgi:hypothetical protein
MSVPEKNVITRYPQRFPLPLPANRTLRASPVSFEYVAGRRIGGNPVCTIQYTPMEYTGSVAGRVGFRI